MGGVPQHEVSGPPWAQDRSNIDTWRIREGFFIVESRGVSWSGPAHLGTEELLKVGEGGDEVRSA